MEKFNSRYMQLIMKSKNFGHCLNGLPIPRVVRVQGLPEPIKERLFLKCSRFNDLAMQLTNDYLDICVSEVLKQMNKDVIYED